jgi:hypothetical protein
MSNPQTNRFPFAKVVVILAIAFLVGVGLCGIDYLLAANGIGKSTEEFGVGILDAPSLVIMCLSAACLIFTLILWAIAAVVSSIGPADGMDAPHEPLNPSEKVSQSQNVDHKADDTNFDKQE